MNPYSSSVFRNSAIVDELAHRGHNVTVISPFKNQNAPANAHYIHFDDEFQSILPEYVKIYMNSVEVSNSFFQQFRLADAHIHFCYGRYVLLFIHCFFFCIQFNSSIQNLSIQVDFERY